jgi:hypothetical protein
MLAALVAVVVGHVGDGPWTDVPTEARSDEHAELAVVVVDGPRVLAPDGIAKVTLHGHVRKAAPLTATVHWFAVEPHPFRATAAANGATSDFYSNVSTEPATFGRWLGYDHIDYFERPLAQTTPVIPAAIDADSAIAGVGTLRFKAEVTLPDGRVATSPGAESTDTFGITPAVHRLSIRTGDDFIGWLTGYLLVPEVFGSAGAGANHQTERFDGADCADVLVGALRRSGRPLAYTNVAGLPAYTTRVAAPTELDDHGTPATPITGVRRGDLIRIDYGGALRHHTPRDWDHVAALYEDRSDPTGPLHGGPDGQLDGFDLVIHMGHPHLVIEPLANQAPATVDVLRWKAR